MTERGSVNGWHWRLPVGDPSISMGEGSSDLLTDPDLETVWRATVDSSRADLAMLPEQKTRIATAAETFIAQLALGVHEE